MQEGVSLQPFATLLTRSRAVTSLFAVDSNIAIQVANAWPFALDGTPAYRIDTSRERLDSNSVVTAIDQCPPSIVVLDGALDMVNEALLFSLIRQDSKKTLIFPVGAYANLSLIAPEVWDGMILVPSEQLVVLPAEPRALQHCMKIPPAEPLNSAHIVGELNDESAGSVIEKPTEDGLYILEHHFFRLFRRQSDVGREIARCSTHNALFDQITRPFGIWVNIKSPINLFAELVLVLATQPLISPGQSFSAHYNTFFSIVSNMGHDSEKCAMAVSHTCELEICAANISADTSVARCFPAKSQ